VLEMMKQQQTIASNQTKVEKSKLLPGLMLGYNNNSFKGTGPDNKNYGGITRFHSVQLGAFIPIFTQAQKARINASRIAEAVAGSQFQAKDAILKNQYKKLLASYQNNLEIVRYYESTGLKNADIITETAQKQFFFGDINYLDFVMLINQAISIQSNYTDAFRMLNESIIQINYLTLN
jgi:cobalt-zinc-cadmium resistance protein CzcA